ncbi:MAG: hypothetical protein M1829_000552 [Trizodia sp. TS-e1964]|nr:MAG: hypothetical protein M1829_000552 [Trizodia sp. TS-e1964]
MSTTKFPSAGLVSEAGLGPMRHPKPLTPSDIYLQLEQEQEAVVNRLTRELSILRSQQSASVVSNTSSNSGEPDALGRSQQHALRPHHRSSSVTSVKSLSSPPALLSAQTRQLSEHFPPAQSRQPGSSIPQPTSIPDLSPASPSGESGFSPSRSSIPTSARYEEVASYLADLEAVKRENDALRRRVKELERILAARRQSYGTRDRSDSASTAASYSRSVRESPKVAADSLGKVGSGDIGASSGNQA